jgi:uncharacterized protein
MDDMAVQSGRTQQETVVLHNGDTVHTRVVLTPLAAPSILGLYGFFGATLIVASNLAGWWGDDKSAAFLFPFALAFGGIAQFMAGMWAYKARDALATAMHGTWGSFWIAWGLFQILALTHVIAPPTSGAFVAFAWWWVALAAITGVGALAALTHNLGLFAVLGTLTAGSVLAAIGFWSGNSGIEHAAGWVFVISAGCAWYVASAMMLAATAGRTILPMFGYKRETNVPGRSATYPIQYEWAEPGIRKGQ